MRTVLCRSILAVLPLLAACGHATTSPLVSVPVATASPAAGATPSPAPMSGPTGTAKVTLAFPLPSTATSSRVRRTQSYLSAKTQSVQIAVTSVNGAAPVPAIPVTNDNVGPGAAGCTVSGTTLTCVLAVTLPVGNVGLSIRTYPTMGAAGQPLSIGNGVAVVTAGANVDVPVTLLPVVSAVVSTIAPASIPGNTAGTATLTIVGHDSAGDVIGGTDPYYLPIVVTTADTSGHVTATPALPATLTAPGQTIALTYDGKGTAGFFFFNAAVAGDAITSGVVPVTGSLAFAQTSQNVYVAAEDDNAVYVYPAGASGASSPTRTISGSNTTLSYPVSVAVDSNGAVYVVNRHRDVTVFAPGANGNVAPTFTYAGGTNPESIVMGNGLTTLVTGLADSTNVYSGEVTEYSAIYLAPGAGGAALAVGTLPGISAIAPAPNGTACAAANPLYDGSNIYCYPAGVVYTGPSFLFPTTPCYGLKFRTDGLLAVAQQAAYGFPNPDVVTYDTGTLGLNNIPLVKFEVAGASTGLTNPYAIDFDTAGNMYVADAGLSSGGGNIKVFAPNANGNVAPVRVFGAFDFSSGVAVGP